MIVWSLIVPNLFPKIDEVKAQGWTQQTSLSADSLFIGIVKISMVNTAINIINENPTTQFHIERVILAKKIVKSPEIYAPIFTIGVAADKTIRLTSTDAVIDSRISAIWNSYIE